MKRDVQEYYKSIQKQVNDLNKVIEKVNKELQEGKVTVEQKENLDKYYATVLTNYNRITYIYHLLCLPPKFIQRFNEWRLNKKYEFDKKKYSNATLEDITKENEAAIDGLKEVVKDDN